MTAPLLASASRQRRRLSSDRAERQVSTLDLYKLATTIAEVAESAPLLPGVNSPRGVLRRATMFEDVISDIQDSIGRLHHEIEARRKGLDDGLDANQIPEARREEPARMQEEMKRLLGKCCRSFRALTERL